MHRSVCHYDLVRTTFDLPHDIMLAAKAQTAVLGERLKDLITRAVSQEVGRPVGRRRGDRVVLPLVGRPGEGPLVGLTNADLEEAMATDDVERDAGA